jgi:MoaA/NifB/PqqE/SkfB family radical SAM enzyme
MWLDELNGVKPKFRCFALNHFAILKCNGEIAPCLSLWDKTIGTIRDSSPTKLWHNEKARVLRKTIRQCSGCLNSWGVNWSISAAYFPSLFNKLKKKPASFDSSWQKIDAAPNRKAQQETVFELQSKSEAQC